MKNSNCCKCRFNGALFVFTYQRKRQTQRLYFRSWWLEALTLSRGLSAPFSGPRRNKAWYRHQVWGADLTKDLVSDFCTMVMRIRARRLRSVCALQERYLTVLRWFVWQKSGCGQNSISEQTLYKILTLTSGHVQGTSPNNRYSTTGGARVRAELTTLIEALVLKGRGTWVEYYLLLISTWHLRELMSATFDKVILVVVPGWRTVKHLSGTVTVWRLNTLPAPKRVVGNCYFEATWIDLPTSTGFSEG